MSVDVVVELVLDIVDISLVSTHDGPTAVAIQGVESCGCCCLTYFHTFGIEDVAFTVLLEVDKVALRDFATSGIFPRGESMACSQGEENQFHSM